MKRSYLSLLTLLVALAIKTDALAQQKNLDIYFIDVEGGAATLIVTPMGESLLVDCGWPGDRDAQRIARVARDMAGLSRIDHFIATHWHADHFGGIERLARLMPIDRFYGHAALPDALPSDIDADLARAFRKVSAGRYTVLKAGDRIELKSGKSLPPVHLTVLAADGLVAGEAPGAQQVKACEKGHRPAAEDQSDNAKSIGFLLKLGSFEFFDGGDLTWNVEHKLVCPVNLPGKVDVYQVNHHGADSSNNPALVRALAPRVAVINNGPRKGGHPRTYATLRSVPEIDSVFQLHRDVATTEKDNAPPEFVANDEEYCKGEIVKLSVDARGAAYSLSVPSKGTSKSYRSR